MLRKMLEVVALLALPALLVAQAPSTPAAAVTPAVTHGIATQIQGEVVMADALPGLNNQEGVDAPDGLNDDADAGDDIDEAGEDEDEAEDEDTPPAPPAGTGPLSRIGRHKP